MGRVAIDLHGRTFGRLTVLSRAAFNRGKNATWICQCICGALVAVTGSHLRSGDVRSCGCLLKETTTSMGRSALKNLVGQRFSRLTVVQRVGHYQNEVVWLCLCACGTGVRVRGSHLRDGTTKSCGCLSKERIAALGRMQVGPKSPMFGKPGTFTGKHHTPETRTRLSAAKIGSKNPRFGKPGTRLGKPGMRGAEHPMWKGGITPLVRSIRTSTQYKAWRAAVFARDDYTCQICGSRGGRLNADHIKPFAQYPQLRFSVVNGRTLCEPCHKDTPTYGSKKQIRRKAML